MSYFDKFDAQEAKLENIIEPHNLLHKFHTDGYPMYLEICQNQAPDAQMELYSQDTDGVSSSDARLVLTFPVGEIGVRVYGRLIVSDTLLNKIKNCGKKMRDLYLQADFAKRKEIPGVYDETSKLSDEEASGEFDEFYEDDSEEDEENEGAEE